MAYGCETNHIGAAYVTRHSLRTTVYNHQRRHIEERSYLSGKVDEIFVKTTIAYKMNHMVCDLLELVRVLNGEMKMKCRG